MEVPVSNKTALRSWNSQKQNYIQNHNIVIIELFLHPNIWK